MTFYFDWEVSLMEWLQSIIGSAGVKIASAVTMLGEELILVAVLGFLYFCYDKELGKRVGLMIVLGLVWNPFLKNLVLRRRPYFDNSAVKCLKPVNADADIYDIAAQGYSFPSGHSTNSAIAYGGIAAGMTGEDKSKRRLWIPGIILPFLVGVSRFILGVHYPTDVLVGWAMGAGIIWLVLHLEKLFRTRKMLYLALFAVSMLGIFVCRTEDYYTGLGLMAGFFLASLFEEKYVHFENTRSPVRCILRLAGAFALYLGLNRLLKMPFTEEFLDSGSAAAFAVRFLRYTIVSFTALGLYPLVFRLTAPGRSGAENEAADNENEDDNG